MFKKIHWMLGILLLLIQNIALANTEDNIAIQKAYYDWCHAIDSAKGNASEVVKFYAPGASLLPTLSSDILWNKGGGLNAYFTELTSYPSIKCTPQKLSTYLIGPVGVNIGTYEFSYLDKSTGAKLTIPARFSFVYEKLNGQWMIVQHHSSKVP